MEKVLGYTRNNNIVYRDRRIGYIREPLSKIKHFDIILRPVLILNNNIELLDDFIRETGLGDYEYDISKNYFGPVDAFKPLLIDVTIIYEYGLSNDMGDLVSRNSNIIIVRYGNAIPNTSIIPDNVTSIISMGFEYRRYGSPSAKDLILSTKPLSKIKSARN